MLDEAIRRRIENLRLAIEERAGACLPDRNPSEPLPLEKLGGLVEFSVGNRRCALFERDAEALVDIARLEEAVRRVFFTDGRASRFIFLDLETTGISLTPLFLAGMIWRKAGRLVLAQVLARDYSEEATVIEAVDWMLATSEYCITFNGKAFDLPYLRERAKYHRISVRSSPEHYDLLHHARKKWKNRLPNCKLSTLEWFILGRRRIGEVNGWEVPCIYHDFVHTKDARRLVGVMRRNLIDLVSTAELFVILSGDVPC